MTTPNGFERRVADWLEREAPMREPGGLLDAVTTRVARSRRLPGWAIPQRWIPLPLTLRLAVVPRAVVLLLSVALLVSIALGSALVAGALWSEGPTLPGLPRNGLIAYMEDGEIWLVDEHGEQRRRLTSGPDDIVGAWSPDGAWLAYWAVHSGDYPGSDISLRAIRPGGAEPRILASGLAWPGSHRECGAQISWSPDSTSVAYARPMGRIDIVPLDGGPSRTLVQDGGAPVEGGRSPSWSPDGRTIAFQSYDEEPGDAEWEGGHLYVTPAVGGAAARLVGTSSVAGSGDCGFYGSQWSPDGSRIAFQARSWRGDTTAYHVWVANADGTGETRVTAEDGHEWLPRWSPDGSRLVVSRYVDDTRSVPVVMAPDGSEQVVLEDPRLHGSQVLWSPDGTRLLTVTDDWEGLAVLDPTGMEPPVIIRSATGAQVWYADWQPLVP